MPYLFPNAWPFLTANVESYRAMEGSTCWLPLGQSENILCHFEMTVARARAECVF